MSRAAAADVVEIKPTMNVYTVLVAVAFLAQVLAFLAMFFKAQEIFQPNFNLFG